MNADVERILSEDETARAAVDGARSRARIALEAARADLAHARQARLEQLERDLERTIADILSAGDREVARRRTAREARSRDIAARAAEGTDAAAGMWVHIVRTGVPPGGAR